MIARQELAAQQTEKNTQSNKYRSPHVSASRIRGDVEVVRHPEIRKCRLDPNYWMLSSIARRLLERAGRNRQGWYNSHETNGIE